MLSIGRRTLLAFVAVCFGHVLLISAQVQSRSGVPVLEGAAFGTFARIQRAIAATTDGIGSIWSHYIGLWGVVEEKEQLERRVLQLEGRVQALEAITSRTNALEELLGLSESIAFDTLVARVIAGDAAPGAMTITIDRGSADGIRPNMAVLGAEGVIGRVINDPLPHVSLVQLLVDRSAAAGGVLERTATGGIVVGGAGDPPLEMQNVSSLHDVQPGDRVVTSGLEGFYPPGFAIGVVETVESGSATYRRIAVRPAVNFSHISHVLVVLERPGEGGVRP